jgi:hypothetical protein
VLICLLRVAVSITSLAITPLHDVRSVASGHDANLSAPANCDEKQCSPGFGRSNPTGALFATNLVSRGSESTGVEIGFLGLDWFDTVLADMV